MIKLFAVVFLAGSCLAASPAGASVEPSVVGTAGNGFATVTVDAHNTGSGTAATGTFTASGTLLRGVSLSAFRFSGPVTCLDVQGDRAGLIYPITSASGAVARYAKGMAIYVTIVDGGPGKPTRIGFAGPAPVGSLTACPPTITFLTGSFGRIVVSGGA